MGKILIENGYIITVDKKRNVYPSGYLVINDNRIEEIGDTFVKTDNYSFEKVIDAKGMVVLPGLINMHQHHWYTLFKGISEGMFLEDWLPGVTLPLTNLLEPQDLELSSYLSAAEMITTGTTCFFNHSLQRTNESNFEYVAKPFLEAGIRQFYGKELKLVQDSSIKEELGILDRLVDKWQDADDGLLRLGMVIETGAHWLKTGLTSEELVREGVSFAHKNGLKISNHITGGTLWKSIIEHIRASGNNDIEYLARLGVLGDEFLLIHCVWLNDAEIRLVSEMGGNIVLCPASGDFTAGGVAPARSMLDAGINVSLGSDGPMVNDSVDMIEQMKIASLLQNAKYLTPGIIPSEELIEMVTINSAKALGIDNEIGSLEAGKKADITIFDINKPHYGIPLRPVSNLIYSGKGTDARYVMVNGKVLVDNYELTTIKLENYKQKAFTRAEDLLNKAGLGDLRQAWKLKD